MNANGVLGSLNFPSMARFCGQFFASRVDQDAELALAVLRAYNDWHLEAWCGAYPERFIPCTIPPIWDPQLMADEIHRTAAKGSHCVSFSMNPHALGCRRCTRALGPVLGRVRGDRDRRHACTSAPARSGGADVTRRADERPHHLLGHQHLPDRRRPHLVADLPEVPRLKVALAEGGIGWIPYFLERADYTYEHHKAWTRPDLGGRLPSEVFRDHIITCFIVDDFGVEEPRRHERGHGGVGVRLPALRHHVAELARGCCGTRSPSLTDEQIGQGHAPRTRCGCSRSTRSRSSPRGCTVGALREEAGDHDISIVSKGKKEHAVTIGAKLAALELGPVAR